MMSNEEMLAQQTAIAEVESPLLNEYVREHYDEFSFKTLCDLFHIGYIEGVRRERARNARRKAVTA